MLQISSTPFSFFFFFQLAREEINWFSLKLERTILSEAHPAVADNEAIFQAASLSAFRRL